MIYPLRMSRTFWNIPIYSIHECSASCANITDFDEIGVQYTRSNPTYKDGKCDSDYKIFPTTINLQEFDCIQPKTFSGRLFNPDQIIIPDSEFRMQINFPLKNATDIVIKKEVNGYTLREIIHVIKTCYEHIYDEEEKTASPTNFTIEKTCECTDKPLIQFLPEKSIPKGDYCCICYNEYVNEACVLLCGHEFHKECLQNWIEKGDGKKCPLCRFPILQCALCQNTHVITTHIESVELPLEFRQPYDFRHETDGVWGISSYYFEQLYLDNLIYNKYLKRLQIKVSSSIL